MSTTTDDEVKALRETAANKGFDPHNPNYALENVPHALNFTPLNYDMQHVCMGMFFEILRLKEAVGVLTERVNMPMPPPAPALDEVYLRALITEEQKRLEDEAVAAEGFAVAPSEAENPKPTTKAKRGRPKKK